jgi:hypothetical protein
VQRNADRLALVLASSDPYSFEVLQHHPDYRALLSIRYLAAMAHKLGVQEEIPTVLSMPLGAVDISLEEAASIYQGFLGGQLVEQVGDRELHRQLQLGLAGELAVSTTGPEGRLAAGRGGRGTEALSLDPEPNQFSLKIGRLAAAFDRS